MAIDLIRVLVVDDYEPWRRFFSTTIQERPDMQVVGEASDGLGAVQQARQLTPHLILLDIGLPLLNGIEAARRIREVSPASKILFASENRSLDIVELALSTGASGYLVKSSIGNELLPAIDAVLCGRQFLSTCLTDHNSVNNADSARREKVVVASALQSGDRHDLRLYGEDGAFVDGFAQSIETTLKSGNAGIVIATESHRAEILQKLSAAGVNVDAAVEQHFLTLLDVAALSTFMVKEKSVRTPEIILGAMQTAEGRHLRVGIS